MTKSRGYLTRINTKLSAIELTKKALIMRLRELSETDENPKLKKISGKISVFEVNIKDIAADPRLPLSYSALSWGRQYERLIEAIEKTRIDNLDSVMKKIIESGAYRFVSERNTLVFSKHVINKLKEILY